MKKYVFSILLLSLALTACGGARSTHNNIHNNSYLTWQAPTTYYDQTPFPSSDIGGYNIYVGMSQKDMSLKSNINDPTVRTFNLGKLGKGTFHIAVTCYDINGIESPFSPILVVNLI